MNTATPSTREAGFLLIYTAPGTNPSYRRGVLDAICYPNGHLIPYSYRRKHIQPVLCDEPKLLIGKEAVIIFVDSDGKGGINYFPIRRVKIHGVSPQQGMIRPPASKERIKLSLQLRDYVQYKESGGLKQWHELVQRDSHREMVGAKPTYFVIAGEDSFTESPDSPSAAWEDLVAVLSKSNEFPEALFMRLNHVKGYSHRSSKVVSWKYEGDRLVYLLRPGRIYRLDLSIFEKIGLGGGPCDGARLEVKASAKGSLDVDQPHHSFISGLAERSALIGCKRSIENIITTITVQTERNGISEKLVNSPSPTLFVRIAVSRWILLLFVLLVFLGGVGVSIDTDFIKELWITGWPVTTTFAAKLTGAAMLAFAAFLAFRRLPSGQR